MMVAPLLVCEQLIGVVMLSHHSAPDFFNEGLAAKATVLTGQLGSLIEASRLNHLSVQEHHRATVLVEIAQAVQALPDAGAVAQVIAERLRVLLQVPLVTVLQHQAQSTSVIAISADTPIFAESVRAGYQGKGLQFASDLASRAVAAGEPIAVATSSSTQALADLVPAGVLLAAPLRTSHADGAVLIYPRAAGAFTLEEKSLVSAVVAFASVAISNLELYGTARAQAHELHQLLEILSQLSSAGKLEEFLRQFVVRAADFLGFRRAVVALLEAGTFHVRWKCVDGQSGLEEVVLPEGPITRTLMNKGTFYSDDAPSLPGIDREFLARFDVRQLLAVPLLGSDSQVLGMLAVLDRADAKAISREHVRSAQALAAQASIALEATRNLQLSREHSQRSESLMRLAVELNSTLQLPEFGKSFVARASELMGAKSAALFVNQDGNLEAVALRGASTVPAGEQGSVRRRLGLAVAEVLTLHSEPIVSAPAHELFGTELAEESAWDDVSLVRLQSSNGELIGALCLANRGRAINAEDEQLVHAITAFASTALENSRLFTRMDQANRHWMEIFDAITDFIVAHDGSENVLRVNRPLADFIGVQPQELIGVNMGALLASGEIAPQSACPFCKPVFEDNSDERIHFVLDRVYLVSTSRVTGARDEGLQTIHVLKDITDRREAERRYRELFDNIQEGVFFSTPDGRFIEVNDALVRMLGYAGREVLLQADIRTQVCVAADQYDEMAGQMQRNGAVRNHEQTLRRQDGSLIHVLVNAFAVRDAHNRITQYRGVMLDISGLKAFQSELQRERDFSGKILNNTQSLILVADTAGLISYANRRWYDMGFEQGQLLGQPLEDLVAPARRKALNDGFAQTLAGQQVDNLDLQLVRGEGRVGRFSVNLSPMRDEQASVASIVVVMSDVTDAATLQAKLMHAEKMAAVGQLVSGVAHEVNNPLTAILGFSDLLMENPEVPENARKDLRIILQEAQRTKQIVQNLLSFARQMPPQRNPVQLNLIVRRTLQLRAYDFHSRGVEIVERLDDGLPQIMGDSHQLQQVFLNIVNNAYDAVRDSGRSGRILVTSAKVGDFVEIVFRDNGHGISFPERIFDPFFTTKEIGKGTGLGLSICYGIVRGHGGEISCQNNRGEDGATFSVRFPAMSEEASAGAAAGEPA
jgi:two-component system NtrC family sensor kinase